MNSKDILDSRPVLIDGRYLGEAVRLRSGTWSGLSADGRSLGSYEDPKAAAAAVLRAAGIAVGDAT